MATSRENNQDIDHQNIDKDKQIKSQSALSSNLTDAECQDEDTKKEDTKKEDTKKEVQETIETVEDIEDSEEFIETCSCGHSRKHHLVTPRATYTAWGTFWITIMGVSATPIRVDFICRMCNEKFDFEIDPERLKDFY